MSTSGGVRGPGREAGPTQYFLMKDSFRETEPEKALTFGLLTKNSRLFRALFIENDESCY